jgi:hypothetical protein
MSKKHTILMLACCLIGMGGVIAVLVFKVPINNVVFGLMLLLCPLSHILMMGMMGHKDHEQHDHSQMDKHQSAPKTLGEG